MLAEVETVGRKIKQKLFRDLDVYLSVLACGITHAERASQKLALLFSFFPGIDISILIMTTCSSTSISCIKRLRSD